MEPGTLVGDRFEIVEMAGRGGMGAVFRARDRTTGAIVALKTLSPDLGTRESATRLAREAEILARLRHPGIVTPIATGKLARVDLPWLAMEWVEGDDLARVLATRRLGLDETLRLVRALADALGAAHEGGVVHRDMSPSNVRLVGGDLERPKVLDFGVARTADAPTLRPGAVLGTPAYMSPEQVRGEPATAAADVYGLGCILFECLVGKPAFAGESPVAILFKKLVEDPPSIRAIDPSIPKALDALVARMTAREPEARPKDGRAVQAALQLAAPFEPAPVEAHGSVTTSPRLSLAEARPTGAILAAASAAPGRPAFDDATKERVTRLATSLGARLFLVGSQALVLVEREGASATELAEATARGALSLSALLPAHAVAAAVGTVEHRGAAPVGAVLDDAVRALERARPSWVAIDDVIARLAGSFVDVVWDGRAAFMRTGAARTGLTTQGGTSTRFVGRAAEIAAIGALVAEARAGAARAALVIGEPGIGKSRIRDEVIRRQLVGVAASLFVARADPFSQGRPLGLFAQAVADAAGLAVAHGLVESREHIRRLAARYVRGEPERTAELLGELVGVPFDEAQSVELREARRDPRSMAERIERALLRLFQGASEQGLVALVLEDFHAGDAASIALVGRILASSPDTPLLVLALAQPSIEDRLAKLPLAGVFHRVPVPPLSDAESSAIALELLRGQGDETAVAGLVERAAGSPFFLEELVRAQKAGLGDAPGTVLAVVQARLGALGDAARRTLRAASVLGRSFSAQPVAGLLDEPADTVGAQLEQLAREGILARSPGETEGRFAFRSSVLRDSAYGMIAERDRVEAHVRAATLLEAEGRTVAEVLALHYERGGRPADAARHLRGAGARALEAGDFHAALAHLDHAEFLSGERARPEVALLRAEALSWLGRHSEAHAAAARAVAAHPEGSAAWYRAARVLGTTSLRLGDVETVSRIAQALADRPVDEAAQADRASACALVASSLFLAGRAAEAERLVARVEPALASLAQTNPVAAADIHLARADRALVHGDLGEHAKESVHAVAALERAGDERRSIQERINVGFAYLELGLATDAEVVLREALALAERRGLSGLVPAAQNNLGVALSRLGRLDEAIASELAAIDGSTSAGDVRLEGGSRLYLAGMLLSQKRTEEALREAERAVDTLAAADGVLPHALARLAEARLETGDVAGARDAITRAWERVAGGGGIEEGEMAIRLARAHVALAEGDRPLARETARDAMAELEARASRIADPSWRAAFLAGVPEHAELSRLWSWLGAED